MKKKEKDFNVNHLGYYNGGLPQKDGLNKRGSSLNAPGEFHDTYDHNNLARNPDAGGHEVTALDASMYKEHEYEFHKIKNRPRGYYTLEHDETWRYVRNRTHATFIILFILGSIVLSRLYKREISRNMRTEKLPENLANKPAHHFVNKGGVLIKKEFIGFAKYFKNDKELTDWYYKVYPEIMNLPDE